jgi:hypothetical protein
LNHHGKGCISGRGAQFQRFGICTNRNRAALDQAPVMLYFAGHHERALIRRGT